MAPAAPETHRVLCHIDRLLAERGMTQTELAERMGLSLVNLSILKNNRARAIRFSTLTALCDVLQCQPGDVFSVLPENPGHRPGGDPAPRAVRPATS